LIVDEFTGRTSEGRTWSEGIHQAIEAREGLPLTPRTRTAAQITVQDFVCRFRELAGMTGTAMESSHEFRAVYGTRTQRIEPRQPSRRSELSTVVLQSTAEKWRAVAEDAQRERSVGRAVLVGTRTVEASEALSEECTRIGLDHVVLSARHPDREAAIVAEAGEPGRVTIATNMAGRGTDIRIADSVRAAGGLHVIGTERHASARIDRQLAGRCARQGDPGTHRWFLSTEDEILLLARSRSGGGKASSSASLTEVDFRNAQRTVERRYERDRLMLRLMNADTLKHYETLGLDPVVDRIE
jgi:preprotein translocase subunit SecA